MFASWTFLTLTSLFLISPNTFKNRVTEMQSDEYGVGSEVQVMRPPPLQAFGKTDTYVPPVLAT